ncbi:hypothetical protein L9F63_011782, partial [Diploptera punctata]
MHHPIQMKPADSENRNELTLITDRYKGPSSDRVRRILEFCIKMRCKPLWQS